MKRASKIVLLAFFLAGEMGFAQNLLTGEVKTYPADCQLAAAAVHAQGGTPPYQVTWSNGALGDSISSLGEGNYTATIKDSHSPQNTLNLDFKIDPIECKVGFDNRFTPNGDGINDHWGASNRILEYPDFLLQVFDRWGQLVHQQRKKYTPWDGTHLSIKVPDGTYYYIFFYVEGKSKRIEKGDVTIIR